MATTALWPIKGKLKDLVNYADNPKKTDPALIRALHYAENDAKTEDRVFVTGVNCSKYAAYSQMRAVKRKFGERGSVVAYHGYQSFPTGEVTPERCHAIGVETARRMWGDGFQVLVATHLNTDNLHNHFVVNSVSYKDGAKFRNKIADHFRLREISDKICREHGLSVLENAPFYDSQRKAYWVHKAGKKTHRDLLREDVERCLKGADTPDEFFQGLEDLGYEVDYERGSVRAPSWERAIRLDRMGYTEEVIRRRTWNSYRNPTYAEDRENAPTRNYSSTSLLRLERQLEFTVEHTHSFSLAVLDLMFLLMIQLLQLTREPEAELERRKPMSPEFRMELERLDEYSKMSELLARYEIHTGEELLHFEKVVTDKLTELEQERQGIRNQLRRCKDPERETELKERAKEVTQRMKPLRELLKTAGKIQERAPKVEKLLLQEKALELEAQQRNRNNNRSYDYER